MTQAGALTALLTIGALATATPAFAQTGSFSNLAGRLAVGSDVVVTTSKGATVEGTVTAVTPDRVTVREGGDGPERQFGESDTQRIVHHDSPINGALLGALSGPVVTLGWLYAAGGSDSFGAVMVGGSVLFGAGGAFIGMMIDDAIRHTVYDAARPRRTAIGPILGRGTAGVGVAITF